MWKNPRFLKIYVFGCVAYVGESGFVSDSIYKSLAGKKNLIRQICLCICRRCSSWITFLSVCLQLLLCRRIGLPTFTDLRLRLLWVRCFPEVRGMSLQGNASSTHFLLVARFGQVDAVNFGNEADFLRLLDNAYAAFYRIGQRRTAWNGHNCANALY